MVRFVATRFGPACLYESPLLNACAGRPGLSQTFFHFFFFFFFFCAQLCYSRTSVLDETSQVHRAGPDHGLMSPAESSTQCNIPVKSIPEAATLIAHQGGGSQRPQDPTSRSVGGRPNQMQAKRISTLHYMGIRRYSALVRYNTAMRSS